MNVRRSEKAIALTTACTGLAARVVTTIAPADPAC